MSNKYRLAEKAALEQRQVVGEIEVLVKSIERCEKTISELKVELEQVNEKHKGRRTTQEDIAYLTDLLKCANQVDANRQAGDARYIACDGVRGQVGWSFYDVDGEDTRARRGQGPGAGG